MSQFGVVELLGLSAIIIALGLYGYKKYRGNRLGDWRKSLNLAKHQAVFQKLYQDIDAYTLSQKARQSNDRLSYIYGEIEFESFIALLSMCSIQSDTVFYDLGSGSGKAVLAAMMVFDVKKSCGIELFKNLADCAQAQKQKLSQLPEYAHQAEKISFCHDDFMHADFSDATIIFINATAFLGDEWLGLSKKLDELTHCHCIVTTTRSISSPHWQVAHETQVLMSWGAVSVFYNVPVNDAALSKRTVGNQQLMPDSTSKKLSLD